MQCSTPEEEKEDEDEDEEGHNVPNMHPGLIGDFFFSFFLAWPAAAVAAARGLSPIQQFTLRVDVR